MPPVTQPGAHPTGHPINYIPVHPMPPTTVGTHQPTPQQDMAAAQRDLAKGVGELENGQTAQGIKDLGQGLSDLGIERGPAAPVSVTDQTVRGPGKID
jgi:hypothetical protein